MSDKPVLSTVTPFPSSNLNDIPAMMRQCADTIAQETDEHDRTHAITAVRISESGDIQVFGWGKTNSLESIAHMHLGIASITDDYMSDQDG